jgi:hypothetical protein
MIDGCTRRWRSLFVKSISTVLHQDSSMVSAVCGTNSSMSRTTTGMTTPAHFCVTVLKNIRKVYSALHEGTDTHPTPTAFTNITDDRDPILDDKGLYSKCDNEGHCSNSSPPVPPLRINRPSVDGAGNAGHAGTSSPMTNTPTLVAFPMPSSYSHASAQAPSFPGSIPFTLATASLRVLVESGIGRR